MKKSVTIRIDQAYYEALKIEASRRGVPYVHILLQGALQQDRALRETMRAVQRGELNLKSELGAHRS